MRFINAVRGGALLLLLVVAVSLPAEASAATFDIYHWDVQPSATVYPSALYATYNPGNPRFRWYVDTASSTHVRLLHCSGSVWSDYMAIPAGDQSYRYFTASGSFVQVFVNDCEQLQAYSSSGTLYDRNGYLLS